MAGSLPPGRHAGLPKRAGRRFPALPRIAPASGCYGCVAFTALLAAAPLVAAGSAIHSWK
jgi:hypothetical protein